MLRDNQDSFPANRRLYPLNREELRNRRIFLLNRQGLQNDYGRFGDAVQDTTQIRRTDFISIHYQDNQLLRQFVNQLCIRQNRYDYGRRQTCIRRIHEM